MLEVMGQPQQNVPSNTDHAGDADGHLGLHQNCQMGPKPQAEQAVEWSRKVLGRRVGDVGVCPLKRQ